MSDAAKTSGPPLTDLPSLPNFCDVVRRNVELYRTNARRAASRTEQGFSPCLPEPRVLDGEGIAP